MSLKPEVLDAMVAAGCTAEQIAAVVKASIPARSSNAERQARYRERHRNARNVTERNSNGETPPKRKVSPCTPSKENNPPTFSEPNGSSNELARDRDEQSGFETFWAAYPDKTGKKAALKAWPRAVKAGGFDAIMAGLRRYVAHKPPDRSWMNPATFLNGERWNDQPAPTTGGQHEQHHPNAQRRSRQDDIAGGVADFYAAKRVREPAFQGDQGAGDRWSRGGMASQDVTFERGEDGSFGEHPRRAGGSGYGRH